MEGFYLLRVREEQNQNLVLKEAQARGKMRAVKLIPEVGEGVLCHDYLQASFLKVGVTDTQGRVILCGWGRPGAPSRGRATPPASALQTPVAPCHPPQVTKCARRRCPRLRTSTPERRGAPRRPWSRVVLFYFLPLGGVVGALNP